MTPETGLVLVLVTVSVNVTAPPGVTVCGAAFWTIIETQSGNGVVTSWYHCGDGGAIVGGLL
jgi:hypothetical protein